MYLTMVLNIFLTLSTTTYIVRMAEGNKHETPGIAVKITPGGLEHLAKLAMDIVPRIFENVEFDDPLNEDLVSGFKLRVFNLKILRMDTPTITAAWLPGEGLEAWGHVASGDVKASYELVRAEGTMIAKLKDFRMHLVMGMREINEGQPQLTVRKCTINITESEIHVDHWLLDRMLDWGGAETLREFVGKEICRLFASTVAYEGPQDKGESLFCGEGETGFSNVGGRVKFPMESFTINMSLNKDPDFYSDHADIGFNGTVLYKDRLSRRTYPLLKPPPYSPVGGKMLRIAVSSMIPNSFFSHVFAYSLGNFRKTMTMSDMPTGLATLGAIFCPGCRIHLTAGLSRPPVMIIRGPGHGRRRQGVSFNLYGWVRTYFTGLGQKSEIFWAGTLTRVRAFPYVSKVTNRLHAHTLIEKIHVKTNRRSGILGKILGALLRDATSSITEFVPLQLNKPVNDALRSIFGPKGGIPLPHVCGIDFVNSSLFYINNSVMVDTDIRYNSAPLIRRFRKQLAKKHH